MDRLFNAAVSLTYEDEHGKRFMSSTIAESGEFWWNLKRPEERSLWESKIELGAKFFEEVIRRPVPLDMHILREIKRSSLGLDLYLWLTYRTFALKGPLRLSWKALYRQFGVDPSKASDRVTVDKLSQGLSARAGENQKRVAWDAVPHGLGRVGSLAVAAVHSAPASAHRLAALPFAE